MHGKVERTAVMAILVLLLAVCLIGAVLRYFDLIVFTGFVAGSGATAVFYVVVQVAFTPIRNAIWMDWSDNRIVGRWPVRGRLWRLWKRVVLGKKSVWN